MAAFTTLALLGLAAAGGLVAGKKIGQSRQASQDAANNTTPDLGGAQPPPAPPSLALTGANAATSAQIAAVRTRRRAQAGATLLSPSLTQAPATPKMQPKTLLGYAILLAAMGLPAWIS